MLWFFERDHESLCLETRYENESAEFVAIVRWPNGREQIERFLDLEAFRLWLVAFDKSRRSRTLDAEPAGHAALRLAG
jgi:hypothetical protein